MHISFIKKEIYPQEVEKINHQIISNYQEKSEFPQKKDRHKDRSSVNTKFNKVRADNRDMQENFCLKKLSL